MIEFTGLNYNTAVSSHTDVRNVSYSTLSRTRKSVNGNDVSQNLGLRPYFIRSPRTQPESENLT